MLAGLSGMLMYFVIATFEPILALRLEEKGLNQFYIASFFSMFFAFYMICGYLY